MIYRQAAIDALDIGAELWRRVLDDVDIVGIEREKYEWGLGLIEAYIEDIKELPSVQPEQTRIFVELVVEYPDPELCTYKEYRGKPYYSIKYIENGETYVGYGTYNPKALSQYLKQYFIPSAQPEQRWIPCSERLPEEEDMKANK